MARVTNWPGTVDECANALAPLLSDGKPRYARLPSEAADENFILEKKDELVTLFAAIPRGNGKYSVFLKAVLKLMTANKYGKSVLVFIIPTNQYIYIYIYR
jgi:hypothetical protein